MSKVRLGVSDWTSMSIFQSTHEAPCICRSLRTELDLWHRHSPFRGLGDWHYTDTRVR